VWYHYQLRDQGKDSQYNQALSRFTVISGHNYHYSLIVLPFLTRITAPGLSRAELSNPSSRMLEVRLYRSINIFMKNEELYESFSEALEAVQECPVPDWGLKLI